MTEPSGRPADATDAATPPPADDATTDGATPPPPDAGATTPLADNAETQPLQLGEPTAGEVPGGDLDGPRRRARREREQRREAQQRATAIEAARREAKRRSDRPGGDTTPVPRGVVRGLKAAVAMVALTAVSIGLGLLLYFTPVMSARTFTVTGTGAVTRDDVLAVAGVRQGTPLLQVDTDTVADRVAGIRRVAEVRVQREYPSTLRIAIVERIPLAVRDFPDGPHLFDRDGVDFATAPPPPGLPYLDVDRPGPNDPPTRAALQVLTSLRPEVAGQLAAIAAPSVASITLTLTDGRTVVWGTTDRTTEKAEKLAALLTQPGSTYDVSSPDLPTVK